MASNYIKTTCMFLSALFKLVGYERQLQNCLLAILLFVVDTQTVLKHRDQRLFVVSMVYKALSDHNNIDEVLVVSPCFAVAPFIARWLFLILWLPMCREG